MRKPVSQFSVLQSDYSADRKFGDVSAVTKQQAANTDNAENRRQDINERSTFSDHHRFNL